MVKRKSQYEDTATWLFDGDGKTSRFRGSIIEDIRLALVIAYGDGLTQGRAEGKKHMIGPTKAALQGARAILDRQLQQLEKE